MTDPETIVAAVLVVSGLALFAFVAYTLHRQLIRHVLHGRQARRELPGYRGFGLVHRPGDGPFGVWEGEVGGRSVVVTPDEYTKIRVGLSRDVEFRLLRKASNLRGGWREFSFGDRSVDAYFDTRHALPEAAASLRTGPLRTAVVEFVQQHGGPLDLLEIEGREVRVSPALGSDWSGNHPNALTPEQIDSLIPPVLRLCEALDPAPPAPSHEPTTGAAR